MEKNGGGKIMAISSMAGIRGRKCNFVYGSTKSALSTYLSGLRSFGKGHSISVTDIIPGFVSTKMTQHLDLPRSLTVTPETMAKIIHHASQTDKAKVYSSTFWKLFSAALRLVPRVILDLLKR